MKNRFLTLMLAGVLLFSGFLAASCSNENSKNSGEFSSVDSGEFSSDGIIHNDPPPIYAETLFPTEASDLDVEAFSIDYFASKYHDDMAVVFTGSIYNYMPEEYAKKYNIGAFEVRKTDESRYYIWHDGTIYCVDHIGARANATFSGFVQFFLSDMNMDGAFEWTVSYHLESALSVTYLTSYDSATKKIAETSSLYEKYAFFKNNVYSDKWGIYLSDDNAIENATEKYSDVTPNPMRYTFAQKNYHVKAKDYEVDITIDEDTINFPLFFKGLQIGFKVKTSMTWLGEMFSYENGNTYLDGAFVQFLNETDEVECEAWMAGEAITYFTIPTGRIIECEYLYRDAITEYREDRNAVGVYAMKAGYRFSDEEIVVNDVLEITNG